MKRNVKTGTYIKGEESFNFDFYTSLKAVDKLRFVQSVTNLLVDDENYNFVIRDLIFDFYIIDIFTNIDTTELENSLAFVNDVEEFLEETNIVEIVKANMEVGLLEELNHAIDLSIEYRTGIHPSPLNEALASLVNTLEKKVDEFDMTGAMEMMKAFNGINGELTPENIVKAYMNTDIAKRNAAEVAESKKRKKNEVKIDENLGEAIRAVVRETKAEKAEKVEK